VIDAHSQLNVSVEYDHLQLHPDLHHVFFPFDASPFPSHEHHSGGEVRIGHAPTNRAAKGSDVIISVIRSLASEYQIRVVLIENLPYAGAIELKASCDIFVDQIGDLGYGINSLEALAMGIPTCSCLAPGFERAYPDHPFIVVDAENLRSHIVRLIENPGLRARLGAAGREWVIKVHSALNAVKRIHELAGIED
jgi:glycosyltransferase involved in cell wall biosynthesis